MWWLIYLTPIGWFIIYLSCVCFVHEMGHFIAARCFGESVPVFNVGGDDPAVRWTWRGTEFQLSLGASGFIQTECCDEHFSVIGQYVIGSAGPCAEILFGITACCLGWQYLPTAHYIINAIVIFLMGTPIASGLIGLPIELRCAYDRIKEWKERTKRPAP